MIAALHETYGNPNGFQKYAGENANASAFINKYLHEGEFPREGCSLYRLTREFQDRIVEVEASELIQAENRGHETLRPSYSKGPTLKPVYRQLCSHPILDTIRLTLEAPVVR